MNLLRSISCLFGSRCVPEESSSTADRMRDEATVPADLGQKEADLKLGGPTMDLFPSKRRQHMKVPQSDTAFLTS